jgi:hypothetical protein
MKSVLSTLFGILVLGGLVGSVVYAGYAQYAEPPLQPALEVIELQAYWSGGTYGVKLTFLTTWLILLLGGFAVPALVFATLHGAFRPRPSLPTWPALRGATRNQRTLLGWALGMTLFAAGFGYCAFLDPARLLPLGGLAGLLLPFGAMTAVAGPFLLLDLALPCEYFVGRIAELTPKLDKPSKPPAPGAPGAPPSSFELKLTNKDGPDKTLTVNRPLGEQLAVGGRVVIVESRVFGRVLELRKG